MLNELLILALQSLWFILPAYFANSSPVVGGGGTPIDFGKKMPDGEPILGPGKTWRGVFTGIAAAVIVAGLQDYIQNRFDLSQYGLITMSIQLGFLLGAGAIVGDSVKSFFKRRLKIARGAEWPLLDQLDFIVGALLFAMLSETALAYLNWKIVLFLVVFTPLIHRATNLFAFKTHLKNVPW
ncbi:MAG: CDP-2,3-bis-(O-geranylgeranyl)-sn-glycerol synthase [Nanoarchaeota archaeon]|nr:CDP-2,3-bis-(O-geranylgeranyl)-sn-glycerol synthase [Nanoarchaeota archaeon]MBU4300631.1 CDP-2,3-bis-(O-geranylgeranyl)-sn-glycerol synthase [Nanoarchaeota archaeon]MBU4452012.1 CDP-2,3-bis-(O-geranylgeranyl)-sn-glycerol synthase [Nanoarchaeota archaeon]MCG2724224.1 CDP-2,3-bis-(O-geranylgeranyl)-sn-glycerol synthase [archaeon]